LQRYDTTLRAPQKAERGYTPIPARRSSTGITMGTFFGIRNLEMQHLEYAKAGKAYENEIDRDNQIEEARHQQDQDACDQRHDGLDVCCRDDHWGTSADAICESLKLYPARRLHDSGPCGLGGFHLIRDFAANRPGDAIPRMGTMADRMNWHDTQSNGARIQNARPPSQRRPTMRNAALAIVTLMTALGATITAHAQGVTVGAAPSTGMVVTQPVEVDPDGGIIYEQRPAFRQYVVTERVPSYTVAQRIAVGAILADEGVTFYDVPQRFGATPYRYTVVNGETVLVEPRTRRIMQVID
jgi:hypothetical protein